MPYLVIIGGRTLKSFFLFEISTIKFTKFQKFAKKLHKFAIKNGLFGYLCARISRNCCHIQNQHSQICLSGKFYNETKAPTFLTKNT